MTKDEIIEMARRALEQEPREDWNSYAWVFADETLRAFAKLVAEHERNACIKIVMQGTGEPIQRKTLDILHQERTRIALAIKEQE